MGFQPVILFDRTIRSNHSAIEHSMVNNSEMWVFDWNRIA